MNLRIHQFPEGFPVPRGADDAAIVGRDRRNGVHGVHARSRLPCVHRVSPADGEQRHVAGNNTSIFCIVRIPRNIYAQPAHRQHIAQPAVALGVEALGAVVRWNGFHLDALGGEALQLPPDTPRGLVTVTFMGQALGQVKNIGTRANNLYPKEWRIRTTHVPQEYEPVLDE